MKTAGDFIKSFSVERRPIKFRAWSPDYGMIDSETLSNDGVYLDVMSGTLFNTDNVSYEDHITPLQYTGIQDIKGNPIYEGDIVRTQEYRRRGSKKTRRKVGVVVQRIDAFNARQEGRPKRTTQVAYDAAWSVDLVEHGDDYRWSAGYWSDFFDCEVIGNVFQNPELLAPQAVA